MIIPGLIQINGYYYYRPKQVAGVRPKRVSLRTKVLSVAIDKATHLDRTVGMANAPGRLAGEVDRYMVRRRAAGDYTRATAQATESTLAQFVKWSANPLVRNVTLPTLEAWQAHLVKAGRTSSTVATYLRRLQGLFSNLESRDLIVENPFSKFRCPSIKSSGSVSFCTRAQRDQLVESCEREDLRFIFMCGFYLGLRRIEIVEARAEWFRTPGVCEVAKTLTFLPKDKERRIIHYGAKFAEFLHEYGLKQPFMLRPDVSAGKSVYRYDARKPFVSHVEAQGFPWVRMHTLRHTFATLHVQAGTPLTLVADWLGDSYDVTHRHYVGYAPQAAHVSALD